MICSSCGYENPAGHRFCGMCGTPLPHRPLTAPGAQSTLSMTRVPVENGRAPQTQIGDRGSVSTETRPPSAGDGPLGGQGVPAAQASTNTATVDAPVIASTVVAPVKELVPDIPYDEYMKTFRYEPPSDPEEVTMRTDARIEDVAAQPADLPQPEAFENPEPAMPTASEPMATEPEPPSPAESKPVVQASPPPLEKKPSQVVEPIIVKDSVDRRLGLDPAGPAEEKVSDEKVERPRFLDIAEPAKTESPKVVTPAASSSGASTIVGPSFLGLSDAPVIDDKPGVVEEEVEEPHGHGRLWLFAAIVAIFAILGVMEWRAQVKQTGNGPVEIIKARMHRGATTAPVTSPDAANDSNAKPEMQVQEQPKPMTPEPSTAGSAASPASSAASVPPNAVGSNASTTTGSTKPNGPAATSTPQTPPANVGTKGQTVTTSNGMTTLAKPAATQAPAADASTQAASQKAIAPAANDASQAAPQKPQPAAAGTASASVEKPVMPGAEEMAKAKNASDSAAEAAWLWKATAKGNPDAPVQLADMYTKGDGVPRSCEQALVLLKTAAAKDNARARNRLAAMYETGNCVQRNRVEAYRWVSSALAANPNSQWAQQNKELIWEQMTPDERVMAQKYR